MMTEISRIAIAEHFRSCFVTASLNGRYSDPNCHCKSKSTCKIGRINLKLTRMSYSSIKYIRSKTVLVVYGLLIVPTLSIKKNCASVPRKSNCLCVRKIFPIIQYLSKLNLLTRFSLIVHISIYNTGISNI